MLYTDKLLSLLLLQDSCTNLCKPIHYGWSNDTQFVI